MLALLLRSRRRSVVTGGEALSSAQGDIVEWDGDSGRVRVAGEIWRARSRHPLQAGAKITVIKREGLVLTVEPDEKGVG